MKKIFSLMKAVMSQDMSLFVYKTKSNSVIKRLIMTLMLSLCVMIAVGSMYYPIALELKKQELTYLLLSISIVFPTLLSLIEGVYKSQGILFEAKDSELLFSLPISKKIILFIRLIKLYVFQFLYSLLFVIPGIVWYAYYENPGIYFYAITTFMFILFPIIPTVIGCFIGFYIQKFSVRFKPKKIVQTLVTFVLILFFMVISFRLEDVINSLIENANNINDVMAKIYYPLYAYNRLIEKFDLIELLKLLAINAVFVVAFVVIASKSFFKVLSKSKENTSFINGAKVSVESLNYKPKNKLWSLIKKDFTRYFSSPVYMINTMFGLVLLIIATVSLCVSFESAILSIASEEIGADELQILFILAPKIYLMAVVGMAFMISITSSSISLEGKAFSISKALPIKTEKILLAKVLMSNIITIPVILICDIIFLASYKVTIWDVAFILIASFVAPTIAATYGLIINLKYPKMDASSDAEVVKQSTSSMVSVLSGIMFAGLFGVLTFFLAGLGDFAISFEIILLVFAMLILLSILKRYGTRRFKEIEV